MKARIIVDMLGNIAKEKGVVKAILHGQTHAENFYTIGLLLYKEAISLWQFMGMIICGAGLFLIGK